jgi:hypothetical protein
MLLDIEETHLGYRIFRLASHSVASLCDSADQHLVQTPGQSDSS